MKKLSVAVIGGYAVGKSCFVASLIDAMRRDLWATSRMVLDFHNADHRAYDEIYGWSIEKKRLCNMSDTYEKLSFPIYMDSKDGMQMVEFTLYDYPCHILRDSVLIRGYWCEEPLQDINAIVYIVDPYAMHRVKEKCTRRYDCWGNDGANDILYLKNFIEALREKRSPKEMKKIPIAVVLSKYDILEHAEIKVSDINTFLVENDIDILPEITPHFKNYDFFGIRSLEGAYRGAPGVEWRGYSVLEPMLFLLDHVLKQK